MAFTEKRTQMYFPADLYRKLKSISASQSRSIASVVREAVERYIKDIESGKPEDDPIFQMIGIAEADEDLSEEHDRYLYGKEGR